MKAGEWFARGARKIGSMLRLPGLVGFFQAPFHGRLQAGLAAWRSRFRRAPSDGVIHCFEARDYPGSRTRQYLVHLPNGKTSRRARPLLLVLHGCRQDHRDIQAISGFDRLSDQHRFLVAYPFVTSYRGLRNRNCWGWWFDREIHAGAGEVEDLWQIVEEIKREYPVDERRIFVTGLSSGAGMAVAMMVAHAGRIAAGAAVAGVPYAERASAVRHAFNQHPRSRPVADIVAEMRAELGPDRKPAPLKVVHSSQDDKVLIESAQTLRDSWGQCLGVDTARPAQLRQGRDGATAWEHSCYLDNGGQATIETLFLEGPGHGWYGGDPGEFSYPDGPDIARRIWRFFKAHPLERRRVPRQPEIDEAV